MTSERLEILDQRGRLHRVSRAHLPVLQYMFLVDNHDVIVPELPERIGVTIDVARHLMNQLRDRRLVLVVGKTGGTRKWSLTYTGGDLCEMLDKCSWLATPEDRQ